MITLFGFGPAFGLPDPSPFVMKTEVQLKLSGLPFRRERAAPPASPKGKVPFIDDDGVKVADSTFIRRHLETAHGIDFDRGLDASQKAQAWTVERLLEDHLYFAILRTRWLDDANFAKGPSHFFDGAPDGVREAGRERVRATLHGHGLGRHAPHEIDWLAQQSLDSVATILGDNRYLAGSEMCGADATMFGMLAGALTPYFDTPLRDAARKHANLIAYVDRMMQRFYPDFEQQAAA
ncbi:MAG TPA: glutathione S-transferase family protein [Rhizomicrobium sp.]|jgi:glutathione S-transferase|nr:glutathione S-transferase family protein [Rhizomicrobium sp.]